ncbi:protein FAM169B-like isoform X1 [Neodiprion fabricii]|uniref:protein FAM169B-like isoform X1 n=1 Tax=Neodiprion fabricii TaxID=2872261 RepID=UPI001ED8F2A9|nr:protein FAM169B-like isoform X1 [Neodiprion fabricii]
MSHAHLNSSAILPQSLGICCRQSRETIGRRLNLSEYKIEGDISRLDCTTCGKFIAIKTVDDVINLDGVIDSDCDDTWLEAKTRKEKIVYYALSQIIYLERDSPKEEKYESVFAYADESDLVMLRWKNGTAIGFFTLKQKGTKIFPESEVEYAMPVLDTAYIRSECRGNGIGTEIITKITQMFPNEDIGFSRPISDGMSKVLARFLTKSKEFRLKFWEIVDGGNEGNKKLVWYGLQNKRKS